MYKLRKGIALFLMMLMVIISPTSQVFAQSSFNHLPVATDKTIDTRPSNLIPISVDAKVDGTGVNVHVGNLGVDGLDYVEVTVSATGYSSTKTKSGYVPALVGKNFSFDFPMIDCNTTYKATIKIVDGGKTVYEYGQAELVYSESALSDAHWDKGTFSSRAGSLKYHFDKHGKSVSAKNLVYYLNYANIYRDEVINDLNSLPMGKYHITTGTGSIPSKNYKNLYDDRFIILKDSDKYILSFGK